MYIADELRRCALELGFVAAGFVPISVLDTPRGKQMAAFYRAWLERGCHAMMDYLARGAAARECPDEILPGAKSLLVLAVPYTSIIDAENVQANSRFVPTTELVVADYACGLDYHHWCRERLAVLAAKHRALIPNARCRGVVDTAPLWERFWAREAKIGFLGDNGMLIVPPHGSRCFLATLLSTSQLTPAQIEIAADDYCDDVNMTACHHCGACRAACPTGAMIAPGVLDARRCLNYWTIEYRGEAPLPPEIDAARGNRLFGCDLCQDVCPYNRVASREKRGINLASLAAMTREEWQRDYGDTPLSRIGWEGCCRAAERIA